MRIIGGSHKRRLIRPPARLPVRPTTDLAKEALFNILNNRIDFEGLRVLDLFAGTGNISLEFASRGAAEVLSIDSNPACITFISQTAAELKLQCIHAIRTDAWKFLQRVPPSFDLIFADPPFDMKGIEELASIVLKRGLLASEAWLIIEHGPDRDLSRLNGFCELRKYGKVHFSLFQSQA